jgi:hypothetical protein
MANSWGESGTTWGKGDWGQQSTTTVALSGLSITGSLGELSSYNEHGWGRSTWGSDDWGDFSLTVFPTGFSITGSTGEIAAFPNTGWGRDFWGEEPWGDSYDPVVTLSGFSITGSLGTLPYAQSTSGWGRDEWGIGNWGENTTTVVLTDSFEMEGRFGPDGWGQSKWGEEVSWGGELTLTTTQLSIAAPTGIEATASLGTPTISRLDMIFDLTTSLQMSAGLGVPNINNGADHSQGVGSLLGTMSLGTVTEVVTALPSGLEATMTLNSSGLTVDDTQLVDPTGIQANFYALGSLTIADMAVGLGGLSITGSLGSLTITDMTIGLSGLEITGNLGSGGVSPLGYKDVDITGNTSYTYVEHSA